MHLHPAAVHFDEQLDHAQSQAQAATIEFKITRAMAGDVKAREEGVENSRQAVGVDANSGIGYRDRCGAF